MTTTTKRWSKRLRNRGVAMVEAGILAPIFAMMMMMTIYLMGTYETKYRTVMMSRYATWSYAANGCTNDEFNPVYDNVPGIQLGTSQGGNGGAVTQQQDQNGGTGSNQYTSGAQGAGASAASSMFMSKGSSTMTWTYSPGVIQTFAGHNQGITTQSQTVCNPKPVGMNVFSYIGNLAGMINI